jgi:hypothetical protein
MEFLSYLKKLGNTYNLIYGNVLKFYNFKVYMHLGLCMFENFDLILNAFKYKCEICQVFIHPFQEKLWYLAMCNSWIMDLTHSKWMNQLMCKC